MMQLQELLLCATSPNSSELGAGAVYLHHMQNTTALASFKQTNGGSRCTAVLESTSSQGGYILAAQPDKSVLNVYNFQKVSSQTLIKKPQHIESALGPTCSENRPSRKVDMHSHR